MTNIAVVGAGLIGRAWAIVFARGGCTVALHDAERGALQEALAAIDRSLVDLANCALLDETPDAVRARIRAAGSLEDAIAGAGYVQESVGEALGAKREIF